MLHSVSSFFYQGSMSKELKAAGKLDPQSPIIISGFLTDSELDCSIQKGHGVLGAKIEVTKNGTRVFEKQ